MASSKHRSDKTAFRFLRWSLTGLLVVLLVAIVAVQLMPWNFLKGPISERVESATGRELVIGGDISFSLLPRPRVELRALAFANADWAQTSDMLTVEHLRITPSLLDLIRGNLVLDQVDVSVPVLNLESRGQQSGNWVLPAMQEQENADQQSGPPVIVRHLEVSDAELRYLQAGAQAPHVLSLSSLELIDDRVSLQARAVMADDGPELPAVLSARASMGLQDAEWQLSDMTARVGDTRISGRIGLDTGVQPPALTAQLHSPSINVTDIVAALPEAPATPQQRRISIPVLPDLIGDIHVAVDEVIVQPLTISNLEARLRPSPGQLSLEDLGFAVADGQVQATASLTSHADFIEARSDVSASGIDLNSLGMGRQAGQLDSELVITLDRLERTSPVDAGMLLAHLDIGTARASYQAPIEGFEDGIDLAFDLEETGEPASPALSVGGRVMGRPVDMTVEGEPLAELANGLADYRWQARVQSGELSAQADGQLGALLTPESFAVDVVLEGSGQAPETRLGPELPPVPRFRFSGRLSREQEQWSLTSLEGNMGGAELGGELHYRNTERPVVSADIDAGRVELATFLGNGQQNSASTGTGDPDPDVEGEEGSSPLALLRDFDGELNLRVATLVVPGRPELTDLRLTARLESGMVGVEPLDFRAAGGSWSSSLQLDATSKPVSGTIDAGFDTIGLSGFGDTFSPIEDRLGSLSGELHLEITETLALERREDLLLPFIGRLTMESSWLRFNNSQADTDLRLDMQTRGLDAGEQAFHIDGGGQYDGAPFSLRFRGDRLLDAREPDLPYKLDVSTDLADTRIYVAGSILRPLALQGLKLDLDVSGPDTHRLSRLLGLPMPDLPPYSITGNLDLDGARWTLSDIFGEVGDSDLGGRLTLDTGARPPHMSGELHSDLLDIEDLGVLLGAEPDVAAQAEGGEVDDATRRQYILPDQPVVTAAWQEVSADLQYRGASVRAANIPLSDVTVDFELVDGRGHINPVRFGVGDGRVDVNLDLDTTPEIPEGTMQLEVRGVDLQDALRELPLGNDSVGTIGAQGKFWLSGSSVAELLASADGGLVMLMTGGKLDALLVELAGLDVTQFVLSWLRVRDPIPINCSYLDLQTRDGIATIDSLAVDTDDTRFTGAGTIDMNTEKVDVTVHAHPKDFSVLSMRTPLHMGGTFANIEPGLLEGELGLRAGSAVLAALAGPVAALVPLLDLGSGGDVRYCDGLASRSLEAIGDAAGNNDGSDRDAN